MLYVRDTSLDSYERRSNGDLRTTVSQLRPPTLVRRLKPGGRPFAPSDCPLGVVGGLRRAEAGGGL